MYRVLLAVDLREGDPPPLLVPDLEDLDLCLEGDDLVGELLLELVLLLPLSLEFPLDLLLLLDPLPLLEPEGIILLLSLLGLSRFLLSRSSTILWTLSCSSLSCFWPLLKTSVSLAKDSVVVKLPLFLLLSSAALALLSANLRAGLPPSLLDEDDTLLLDLDLLLDNPRPLPVEPDLVPEPPGLGL